MTVLLDPVTGQVRGILRDPPQADAAAALAPQAGVDSLDVLFSHGHSRCRGLESVKTR